MIARFLICLSLAFAFAGCGKKAPKLAAEPLPAQEAPAEPAPPPPPPTPESAKGADAVDTTSKAAILCYHQFTANRLERTEMRMFIEDFRKQLQTLKDNQIPVIPMSDFLAWRRGEKNIPKFAVIITIDDGYDSTYGLAMPLLKEFGFPFTAYLYTNFLAGGGKTLTIAEVKELLANGGELGSHSVSHQDLRHSKGKTPEVYAAWLKEETEGSRLRLKEKIGVQPMTFAYPFGAFNEAALEAGKQAGYAAMVTVAGRKIGWDTDMMKLGRYVVSGVNDKNFALAVSSQAPGGMMTGNELAVGAMGGQATDASASSDEAAAPKIPVTPAHGSTITERQPMIEADLSSLEDIDPASVKMVISGLGEVAATFDQATRKLSHKPIVRFRAPDYWVQVTLQRKGQPRPDIVRWRFALDPSASYIPADWKPAPPDGSEEGPVTASRDKQP